jgi:hypothetical protein
MLFTRSIVVFAAFAQWQYNPPEQANEIRVDYSKVIWDLEGFQDLPYFGVHTDTCTSDGFGTATARVDARTSHVDGSANAWDNCTGDDVRMMEAGTSSYSMGFQYIGQRQGLIRLAKYSVQVAGYVHLVDDDCAAAALGFAEFSPVPGGPIAVGLSKSAGETTSTALGDLEGVYSGLGVNFPIIVTTGEGEYRDENKDSRSGLVFQNNTFSFSARCRGYMEVWANSYLAGTASCHGSMWGRIVADISLEETD